MNKSNENFLIVQNAIDMSSNEAFRVLAQSNDSIKPYALINIDNVKNQDEADLFVFHLTNQPGPTREACALRLKDVFGSNGARFLRTCEHLETLTNAICDINPNVCRAVIEFITDDKNLSELMMPYVIKKINELLDEFKVFEKESGAFLDNKMRNRKNHAKNKKLFNLYWCLEAIGEIIRDESPFDESITEIVRYTSIFVDYTIREKSAKILAKLKNPPLELLQKLKNDENFYVKNYVCDKMRKRQ